MDRDGLYTLDGERINTLRRQLGWSTRKLAQVAGTSHDTIIDLEHNRRRSRHALVVKLATALDVAPRELRRDNEPCTCAVCQESAHGWQAIMAAYDENRGAGTKPGKDDD